jgi:hypothetical protein
LDVNETQKRIKQVNEIVSTFSPEYKRMFYYRYDKNTLQIIRSVKIVCELMVFSEETYRTKMNEIKQQLLGSI